MLTEQATVRIITDAHISSIFMLYFIQHATCNVQHTTYNINSYILIFSIVVNIAFLALGLPLDWRQSLAGEHTMVISCRNYAVLVVLSLHGKQLVENMFLRNDGKYVTYLVRSDIFAPHWGSKTMENPTVNNAQMLKI